MFSGAVKSTADLRELPIDFYIVGGIERRNATARGDLVIDRDYDMTYEEFGRYFWLRLKLSGSFLNFTKLNDDELLSEDEHTYLGNVYLLGSNKRIKKATLKLRDME